MHGNTPVVRSPFAVRLTQEGVPEMDRFGNGGVLEHIEQGWRERIFGQIKKVFGYGHNLYGR